MLCVHVITALCCHTRYNKVQKLKISKRLNVQHIYRMFCTGIKKNSANKQLM